MSGTSVQTMRSALPDNSRPLAGACLPPGCFFPAWRSLTTGLRLPRLVVFALGAAAIAFSSLITLETALSLRGPAGLAVEAVTVLTLWIYFYLYEGRMSTLRSVRQTI